MILSTVVILSTIGCIFYFNHKQTGPKFAEGTKMLIFDFDGTIADSLPALFQALNNNASYYGYKKIDNLNSLIGKDSAELLQAFEISFIKLPLVVNAIRKEISTQMTSIKPFDNLLSIFSQLHSQGIKLGIVTTNSTENVKQFLAHHNLDYFDLIHGGNSLFGKGKILHQLLKDHNLKASDIIYIGDETRDIDAAKENSIRCAAVTWGLCTAEKLTIKKPDFMISEKSELLALAQLI